MSFSEKDFKNSIRNELKEGFLTKSVQNTTDAIKQRIRNLLDKKKSDNASPPAVPADDAETIELDNSDIDSQELADKPEDQENIKRHLQVALNQLKNTGGYDLEKTLSEFPNKIVREIGSKFKETINKLTVGAPVRQGTQEDVEFLQKLKKNVTSKLDRELRNVLEKADVFNLKDLQESLNKFEKDIIKEYNKQHYKVIINERKSTKSN
jgi:hypothetical protein